MGRIVKREMKLGATLYIKNTVEAVEFYKEAFGIVLDEDLLKDNVKV